MILYDALKYYFIDFSIISYLQHFNNFIPIPHEDKMVDLGRFWFSQLRETHNL